MTGILLGYIIQYRRTVKGNFRLLERKIGPRHGSYMLQEEYTVLQGYYCSGYRIY